MLGGGNVLVNVVDSTVGRVGIGKEVKVVKESSSTVILLERPGAGKRAEQSSKAQETRLHFKMMKTQIGSGASFYTRQSGCASSINNRHNVHCIIIDRTKPDPVTAFVFPSMLSYGKSRQI